MNRAVPSLVGAVIGFAFCLGCVWAIRWGFHEFGARVGWGIDGLVARLEQARSSGDWPTTSEVLTFGKPSSEGDCESAGHKFYSWTYVRGGVCLIVVTVSRTSGDDLEIVGAHHTGSSEWEEDIWFDRWYVRDLALMSEYIQAASQ